jgi:hypothetical protein
MVKKMEFGKLISQMDKQKTNFKKWNSWRSTIYYSTGKILSVELGQNGKIIPTKDLKNYSINEKSEKQPK